MRLDEEEEEEPNYAAVPVEEPVDVDHQEDQQEDHQEDHPEDHQEDHQEDQQQQPGTFAILISNLPLFFSSVFSEELHLRV